MPTGATDLGFDVVANQPQTELNYRVLVDTSGTEASLASINAIQQAGGGGRLAFSTDAADGPLAQRMLIDNQGNVGIGTENPGARLDVAGDAKFNGDLSVTGKLTAASFAGNGAGLSNVAPADSSITSAKLAIDSASFSKVTGGKMVISADNVGIGTANPGARLDVAGDAKFNGPLNVQGALTVSGVATIGGDLSVTGRLTAASFAGNGAGLSNVTPADNSITSAKLAQDAASLSKVSGGKMVISGDNVGIGTANPGARLDVAGDAKFNGPLNVQGALTVSAVARIGGDLSVTGQLTAASFRGNGAGLSNVTPADNSITSAKLAQDVASLSKVTGGRVVISGGNVGIGIGATQPAFRLDVGDRIRLRQGPRGTAGIWLFQTAANADAAFFGMHADNLIGFYGAYGRPQGGGVGWGLTMRTDTGDVQIAGRLTARAKTFKIDHPLDPENKYLSHSSVESPDVMNIYNGNTTTDSQGNATVMLPDYFEALNGDFRYQLTAIGKLAQAAVASEIENNRFAIRTNEPNVKVSWQVTGIRQDASAKAHRLPVEEEKPEAERGLFLHPEDYGQPRTKGIAFTLSRDLEANAWPSNPYECLLITTTKLQPAKPDEELAPQGLLPAEPPVKFHCFHEERLQVNSTLTDHDFCAVLELPF